MLRGIPTRGTTGEASSGAGAHSVERQTGIWAWFAALRHLPIWFPWLAWVALAFGLIAAVVAGLWTQREIESDSRAAFNAVARDISEQVKERIRSYSEVPYSVRAFIDASNDVSRAEFHRFGNGLDIARRYPGITNLSHSFRIRDDQRAAFEQTQRQEGREFLAGLPKFTIVPSGPRAEYVVLTYIEPLAENVGALGLDLASDPVRNTAVEQARDSGEMSTTTGMTLLRDRDTHAISVLLRLAVYRGGGVPATLDERRARFAGVAGVAIRLPDMFAFTLTPDTRAAIRLRIEDTTAAADQEAPPAPGAALLFDTSDIAGIVPPVAFHQYAAARQVEVGNRRWTVTVSPLDDPTLRNGEWWLPYGVGLTLAVMALLFFVVLRSLAAADSRGLSLRRSLRTLEFHRARLAETQELANIGGYEWDTRDRRQVWSDNLYRILGRAVGDPPHPDPEFFYGHVVHHDDKLLVRDGVRRVLEDRGPVSVQCRVVRKDGVERIVAAVARLEDADDGERTRVVGTMRDITDEWLARERERAHVHFVQSLMDAVPTPVFQKDRERRFQSVNEAWCRFVGKPREQMLGRTIEEVLPGKHIEAIRMQDERLLQRIGTESLETILPDGSGEPRIMMLHMASYVMEDRTIAGLVGVGFDVTETKETKDRLEHTITELDRRTRLAELLGEFGEVLQACLGLDDAYEAIGKYLPRLAPGTSGALYRVQTGAGHAERLSGWGTPAGLDETLDPDQCVAVRRGQPRRVEDGATELNCRHFNAVPRSYACLPLSSHGELLGVLHVQYAQPGRDADEQTTWPALRTAAEHISLALANLTIREALREQATHDKLTGLYNRHYLHARFDQEIARAIRHEKPAAVIVFDIDHFKRFNDSFGHAAGDHVLRELGTVLRRAGRRSDIACRFGGEEFVLFMPDTPSDVALARAESVRVAVKSLRLDWDGQALGAVTVSAGVAVYPVHGDQPDALLRAADLALYHAKQSGRDRVVLAAREAAVSDG